MQDNKIRDLAHQLWQQRGCPMGDPMTDWLKAEKQINGKSKTVQTQRSGRRLRKK